MFSPFGGLFGPDHSTTPAASVDELRVTQYRIEVCVSDAATVVPPVDDPPGGGTVPPGTDPTEGVSLCGAAVPLAWLTLTPADSSTVYRYTKVPINITTDDDPRVESFGSVTRTLTSDMSEFRGSSMSIVLIDTDRTLRDLDETDAWINARVSVYLSTEVAVRAGLTPRRVFDGIVTDTEPLGGLLFRLQVADYFATLLEEFSAKHKFPQRVFTVEDFPNMGNAADDPSSPGNPAMLGKPVPIGYGLIESTPVFVGKRLVNGFLWDEWVIAGHAAAAGGVLRIDGDMLDGTRGTFNSGMAGVDYIAPAHEPSWTLHTGSAALYGDYNSNRYFRFFARGPRSDNARQGSVPFVVRWGGREDVGDSTGVMIDGLITQILHLFINDVFGGPYTSGAWLAPPTVPVDLYSRINTASFAAVQTLSERYVAGGFKGSFLLGFDGEANTLADVLAKAARTGGFDLGVNADGQLMATMIDPTATLNRAIVDVTDVTRQSFKSRRRRDQLKNTVTYRYAKFYYKPITNETPAEGARLPAVNPVNANPEWASGDVTIPTVPDPVSVAKYGTRTFDLSLDFTDDQATADAVAGLKLATTKTGPVVDVFTERLCGCDTELGDRDTLTHFELPPSAGTDRSMRCETHTLDLDAFLVEKDYRDLAHVDYSALEL